MTLKRKYLSILLILQICVSLPYCKEVNTGKKSDKLRIAVIPGLNMRSGPSSKNKIVTYIPLNEVVTVIPIVTKEVTNPEKILGLEGRWIKVRFNGIEGWVFESFLLETSDENCYKIENSKVTKGLCSSMLQTQLNDCLKLKASEFPKNFKDELTLCTDFNFRSNGSYGENFKCDDPYISLFSDDGSISRNFQQHEGWSGDWIVEGNQIKIKMKFWREDCSTGCSYSEDPETKFWKECVAECQKNGGDEEILPKTFSLQLDANGRTMIGDGNSSLPICFKSSTD
ncbi:SH3 domain-containing protein [Leptospira yasudae]|uniref:SH3 domain-containing protein n=1 Tax=Leptospira yasudae TaxID=2202201 RepID=UPI001C4FABC7|nr:SH3 domain-containing protein [Leptospira yasudae]MBW0436066.1 SH3 domain-containing protein [Leptospira yasudae]